MLIHVTQSHIDQGCRSNAECCPVARAITEALDLPCRIDYSTIFIGFGPDSIEIETPMEVKVRIKHYDDTGFMEPFEFELDVKGVE